VSSDKKSYCGVGKTMGKKPPISKGLAIVIILLFVGMVSPSRADDDLNVHSINKQIYSKINMFTNHTLYVDDNNTEGPWDGTIEHPYQYINDATKNATEGDTVFVFSGTYNEQVYMETSVQLIGENKNSTIIDGGGIRGSTVVCHANRITVSGFTIQRCGSWANDAGVWIHDAWSHHSKNNTISGNIIRDNNNYAIDLYKSNNNIITNNIIVNNSGIVEIGASYNLFSNNTLINNSIRLGGGYFNNVVNNILVNSHIRIDGGENNIITLNNLSKGDIHLSETTKNSIKNNTIFSGIIHLEEIISSFNQICRNKFFGKSGVVISGSERKHWINHIIMENTVDGKPIEYYDTWFGIFSPAHYEVGQLILVNCHLGFIMDLAVCNVFCGIQLAYCSGVHILRNQIRNNSVGIRLINSRRNEIRDNVIVNNSDTGIYAENSNMNVITHNDISHNTNALLLRFSVENRITRNNFIQNTGPLISYVIGPVPWMRNIFRHNYYSDRLGLFPYVVFGKFFTRFTYSSIPGYEEPIILPWVNIDWFPALSPYYIGV